NLKSFSAVTESISAAAFPRSSNGARQHSGTKGPPLDMRLFASRRESLLGWLSRRVDLSQHQSLRVGFSLAQHATMMFFPAFRRRCLFAITAQARQTVHSAGMIGTTTRE